MLLAAAVLSPLPAPAAGIMVLTKAEPGLSQAGTPIWTCTYIVENREVTLVLDTACPASMPVR